MTCSACAINFCFLCLETQESRDSSHAHVLRCRLNPDQGNYFVDQSGYQRAHRSRQIFQIQRALEELCPLWRVNAVVIEALKKALPLLTSNGISSNNVTAEMAAPLPPGPQQNEEQIHLMQIEQAREREERERREAREREEREERERRREAREREERERREAREREEKRYRLRFYFISVLVLGLALFVAYFYGFGISTILSYILGALWAVPSFFLRHLWGFTSFWFGVAWKLIVVISTFLSYILGALWAVPSFFLGNIWGFTSFWFGVAWKLIVVISTFLSYILWALWAVPSFFLGSIWGFLFLLACSCLFFPVRRR
jgi:cation transport ATPase